MPIELVSPEAEAGQLVADGLSCRPELAESRHLIAEASVDWIASHMRRCCRRASGCQPRRIWRRSGATVADFAGDSISTPRPIGNSAISAGDAAARQALARGSNRPD